MQKKKDYLDNFPKPKVVQMRGRPKKCFYCKKNNQDGVWSDSLGNKNPICSVCLKEKTSEAKKLMKKFKKQKIFG